MKVAEIRKNSLVVICNNGVRTVVSSYNDKNGTYVFNEELKKQYMIDSEGYVFDSTYLGS